MAGVKVLPCSRGPNLNLGQDNLCPGKLLVFPHPVLGSDFNWVTATVFCICSYSSLSSDSWAECMCSNGIIKLTTKKMMTISSISTLVSGNALGKNAQGSYMLY